MILSRFLVRVRVGVANSSIHVGTALYVFPVSLPTLGASLTLENWIIRFLEFQLPGEPIMSLVKVFIINEM